MFKKLFRKEELKIIPVKAVYEKLVSAGYKGSEPYEKGY